MILVIRGMLLAVRLLFQFLVATNQSVKKCPMVA
jgi:hypothetical protein